MQRLTYKECSYCELVNCESTNCKRDILCLGYNTYEKLKEYEDLEEQGLLLRLPCKTGDYIYIVYENKVYKSRVQGISASVSGGDVVLHMGGYPVVNIWGSEINRIYFLTREEAEARLKELEGEE